MKRSLQAQFDALDWKFHAGFDLYGTRFGIRVDDDRFSEAIRRIVPVGAVHGPYRADVAGVSIVTKSGGTIRSGAYVDSRGFETAYEFDELNPDTLLGLETKLQFILALLSVPERYFLHAGAVAIGGAGILIPATTRAGKTTLVREFVANGAEYYTDDCAIVGTNGLVYPNPAPLAVRSGEERLRLTAQSIGGAEGREPVRVRYVLTTRFVDGAKWQPAAVSSGDGAFQVLANLFYPGVINEFPAETLKFVRDLSASATFFTGDRGEAAEVVKWLKEIVAG